MTSASQRRRSRGPATCARRLGLDEKVNRLALICRAMFELMEASSGVAGIN